jgi:hypothetical protein
MLIRITNLHMINLMGTQTRKDKPKNRQKYITISRIINLILPSSRTLGFEVNLVFYLYYLIYNNVY